MIVAEKVHKSYRGKAALAGFDLEVRPGTVCGLLGPNGAGKTTAVRILTTLLGFDAGRASVAGFDVATHPAEVRRSIGLVGQHAALDEILSGRRNLEMFGRLYHLGARRARARADELLERFGLAETGGKPVKDYSGGMRRRLDLAAGMILSPPVLFLDEPTTGLDPRSRAEVWAAVRGLGATVLLTTQYLEEADQLADRIVVLDAGRVVAEGTSAELKARLGGDRLDVVVRDVADLPRVAGLLAGIGSGEPETDPDTRHVSVPVRDRMAALAAAVTALDGLAIEDLAVRRPTLDEVFLDLTENPTHPSTETPSNPSTETPAGTPADPRTEARAESPGPVEKEDVR
ncbi:ATP-binding cassette domain-containing protein [Nonomuraea sp. NPDC050328]|uniref:ATP-binding cassette domain-containing protein n=1 Tax=Nonomuraea sp. NPDC050328 TaxID=3364361 RepID=UPI00378A6BBB